MPNGVRVRRHQLTAVVFAAIGAAVLAGCGISDTSTACRIASSAPVQLSDDYRVLPRVATSPRGDAIVAWESTTGEPVEVRTRPAGGSWSPVVRVAGPHSHDPAVAIDANDRPWVAVSGHADGLPAVIVASGPTWTPTTLSVGQANARKPQIGASDGALIVVWLSFVDGRRGVVSVSELAHGTWSPPRSLSQPQDGIDELALSVAPSGSAVATWTAGRRDRTAAAVVRTPNGIWSSPMVLSTHDTVAIETAPVATDSSGWAVWTEAKRDNSSASVRVRKFDGVRWTAAVALDRSSTGPRQMARPGQSPLGPSATKLADGGVVAAWTLGDGSNSVVRARIVRPSGRPGRLHQMSQASSQAGAPRAAVLGDGTPVAAWEEIDGGLLRVRYQRLTETAGCVDVTGEPTETSSISVAGGRRPLIAFVDLRRSRVYVQVIE